jgi:hypothetical protein
MITNIRYKNVIGKGPVSRGAWGKLTHLPPLGGPARTNQQSKATFLARHYRKLSNNICLASRLRPAIISYFSYTNNYYQYVISH